MGNQKNGGIVWTDQTWNPLRGCSKVSSGCDNCYAEAMAARFCGPYQPYDGTITKGKWNGKVILIKEHLADPLRWERPRLVFVNSMSDLFHPSVAFPVIAAIFGVMAQAKHHTYQILTKRPERMAEFFEWVAKNARVNDPAVRGSWIQGLCRAEARLFVGEGIKNECENVWPLPNVHLGVTAENQEEINRRVPFLLAAPAAFRWVSIEPMLGPVGFLDGMLDRIDAVVVGGESGPNARPMNPVWPAIVRGQCQSARVPFTFKQWGEWAPDCLCGNRKPCRDTERPAPGSRGVMFRCGKRKTGHLLGGELYNAYPERTPEGTGWKDVSRA
jgi:protein gp37